MMSAKKPNVNSFPACFFRKGYLAADVVEARKATMVAKIVTMPQRFVIQNLIVSSIIAQCIDVVMIVYLLEQKSLKKNCRHFYWAFAGDCRPEGICAGSGAGKKHCRFRS
ncbi:MAG: hypothetical protein HGB22_02790 [Chlorobiaceae bacterium]|nr:hypothetical protein [Chlorobiaceae bacterium]